MTSNEQVVKMPSIYHESYSNIDHFIDYHQYKNGGSPIYRASYNVIVMV